MTGVILLSVWKFDRRVSGHRYCGACGVDVHGLGCVAEEICQGCGVDLLDEIVQGSVSGGGDVYAEAA